MLARAAEARDGATGVHIEHVRDLAAELAAATGVVASEIEHIAWSAMLHDVGKIRVPDRVLLKPGRLDEDEWALIRQHPLWGEELLIGEDGFKLARQIARWHHEDWDGSGYPDGLRGEAIPLAARIVRVVDVYDALRSERPYKPVWTLERTLEELRAMRGRGLDPDLTDVFVQIRDAQSRG
ncbi:MAG: HD domain-containing protein [Chloroflexi bacterium]|nr:HD domain-containing protein [Chloroflexota bacterium]